MNYLLDTCTWLYLLNDPEALSDTAKDVLLPKDNYPVGLATISIWEVAKKESLGKLDLNRSCKEWLRDASLAKGIEIIPISHSIAWTSAHLPGIFHKDPADQIIVATAQIYDLTLITADKKILNYEHVRTIAAW